MDNSPLNKLPPELRLSIYEFVLSNTDSLDITYNHVNGGEKICVRGSQRNGPHLLALTQTCAHIRRECDTLFFSLNPVVLRVRDFPKCAIPDVFSEGFKPICALSKTIGRENVAALRSLTVDLGPASASSFDPQFAILAIRDILREGFGLSKQSTQQELKLKGEVSMWALLTLPEMGVPFVVDLREPEASSGRAVTEFAEEVNEGKWLTNTDADELAGVQRVLQDWWIAATVIEGEV